MTKNIIIAFLVLASIALVFYANSQSKLALTQIQESQANLALAERNAAKASQQEQMAVEAAARAAIETRKVRELQTQLENCK